MLVLDGAAVAVVGIYVTLVLFYLSIGDRESARRWFVKSIWLALWIACPYVLLSIGDSLLEGYGLSVKGSWGALGDAAEKFMEAHRRTRNWIMWEPAEEALLYKSIVLSEFGTLLGKSTSDFFSMLHYASRWFITLYYIVTFIAPFYQIFMILGATMLIEDRFRKVGGFLYSGFLVYGPAFQFLARIVNEALSEPATVTPNPFNPWDFPKTMDYVVHVADYMAKAAYALYRAAIHTTVGFVFATAIAIGVSLALGGVSARLSA
ncbi:MAG: hypothetical protein DRJ52_08090 [Thermoprotei archaeon]|nr:MAG: hypothetical protein DRJ52_08090 [Thermoprotei archaeon]